MSSRAQSEPKIFGIFLICQDAEEEFNSFEPTTFSQKLTLYLPKTNSHSNQLFFELDTTLSKQIPNSCNISTRSGKSSTPVVFSKSAIGQDQGWDSTFLRTGSKKLQTSDRIYIYDKIKQLSCYLMKYQNRKTFYYVFLIHLCKLNALIDA